MVPKPEPESLLYKDIQGLDSETEKPGFRPQEFISLV